MKKVILTSLALLLLSLTIFFIHKGNVVQATASTITVPSDFATIQAAVDHANAGDIIYVSSGIYHEHVIINKAVTLVGENKETTIVDGSNIGTVFKVTAHNVNISGFKLQNTGWKWGRSGVEVSNADNCIIKGNVIFHTCHQIRVVNSISTEIIGNTITAPRDPFPQSAYGIRVENSTNCLVIYNNISSNIGGIHLENATNCIVTLNHISQNSQGIRLYSPCVGNRIFANTITNNTNDGMIEAMPTNQTLVDNSFFHNNFINNSQPFIYKANGCIWDNGFEGNYWTAYSGEDSDQDGIGDTPYNVGKEQDRYPIMGIYYECNISLNEIPYRIALICDSPIKELSYGTMNSEASKAITFNITTIEHGFCRLSISKTLLDEPYTILVDGSVDLNSTLKLLNQSNSTHAILYFTYPNATHRIAIFGAGTTSVPHSYEAYVFIVLLVLSVLSGTMLYFNMKGRRRLEKNSNNGNVSFIVIEILLVFSLLLASSFSSMQVEAVDSDRVQNLDTGIGYASIQEAIDASGTLNGHTLSVKLGTYFESVRIYKSLVILGGTPEATIIDGEGIGTVVHINASNVCISGFTIRNSGIDFLNCGILLDYCSGVNISHNVVTSCRYGIYVFHSNNNTLAYNNVSGNYENGIWLYYSGNNVLEGNTASSNRYNFGVFGGSFMHFSNSIEENNLVDNKPIKYLISTKDIVLDDKESIGTIYIINGNGITIKNQNLTKNGHGIFCWNLTNSRIENVTALGNNYGIHLQNSASNNLSSNLCSDNWVGILLQDSDQNLVDNNLAPNNEKGISFYQAHSNQLEGNTVSHNLYGMRLFASSFNQLFHNNLVDNTYQTDLVNSYQNVWDNGFEGNYWSDYNGADTNLDGVGDSPWRGDLYPLMGRFSSFRTEGRSIEVISNSTINSFAYFRFNSTIRIYVSNSTPEQNFGFCRVRIPNNTISEPYIITIEGKSPIYWNYCIRDKEHDRWIYFVYAHSMLEITIVPEFSIILATSFLFLVTPLVVSYRRLKNAYW